MIHRRSFGATLLAAILAAGCAGGQPVRPFTASEDLPARVAPLALDAIPQASTYRTLYSFGSTTSGDGYFPEGTLINVNGILYGATFGGGRNQFGTVYRISLTGTEHVLHSFGAPDDPTDGKHPGAGASLLDVNGTLFGATLSGNDSCGTIYSISPTGTEKVVHSFNINGKMGCLPENALINAKDTLYGVTQSGGKYDDSTLEHGGTVFSISPTRGTTRVLHSFGNGNDGHLLTSDLIYVNGTLYGVTFEGGSHGKRAGGYGTVFSISPTGDERVLHNFGATGADGTNPYDTSGLIDVNGTLYGTTFYGGKYNLGTVFSISLTGTERVLHYFGESGDGTEPRGGLTNVNGTLYGTTTAGGKYNAGTVFEHHSDGNRAGVAQLRPRWRWAGSPGRLARRERHALWRHDMGRPIRPRQTQAWDRLRPDPATATKLLMRVTMLFTELTRLAHPSPLVLSGE